MGSRRGFICRMKVGNLSPETMNVGHLNRLKQRNSLGPGRDGQNYAVVHCTGYIKNWPPTGKNTLKFCGVGCGSVKKKYRFVHRCADGTTSG